MNLDARPSVGPYQNKIAVLTCGPARESFLVLEGVWANLDHKQHGGEQFFKLYGLPRFDQPVVVLFIRLWQDTQDVVSRRFWNLLGLSSAVLGSTDTGPVGSRRWPIRSSLIHMLHFLTQVLNIHSGKV